MSSDPGSSAERYVLKDFRGSSHRILKRWVEALPSGARVLELGPGLGHVARLVRRDDLTWVGLEGSLSCLPGLREAMTGVAILDLETVARLPRGFDVVLAADTLEHLRQPEAMLGMVRACLPPHGVLLMSVPNVANLYVRLNLLLGRFDYAERGILDRTHLRFFTRRSLRRMLETGGFDVDREAVSTIPLPLAWPWLPRPALAVMMALLGALTRVAPGLLGYQLLVAARRREDQRAPSQSPAART